VVGKERRRLRTKAFVGERLFSEKWSLQADGEDEEEEEEEEEALAGLSNVFARSHSHAMRTLPRRRLKL